MQKGFKQVILYYGPNFYKYLINPSLLVIGKKQYSK